MTPARTAQGVRVRAILYLAFVASGAGGLVYELAWSRYLALLLGHSAYAQVLVIAVYLGGMAVGALAVGDRSRSLARPLLWYAAAEGVLGVAAFAFHALFRGASGLAYDVLLPALGSAWAAGTAKWVLAVLLVAPQAVLLGTTFPLMSAGVLRRFPDEAGRTLGTLYFANSFGAAAGVLAAGFVFVGLWGLPGTMAAGGALSLFAGALVYAVAVATPGGAPASVLEERGVDPEAPAWLGAGRERLWELLLAASFLTAVASFVYEIGWIRMLSLVMGSATHSFEIMLSAFILGLALGALAIRRAADESRTPVRLLGWIQWAMGLAALATLPVYALSFDAMAWLVTHLPGVGGGYALFNLTRYGLALGVMLPATVLAGMTLPLITATLLRAGRGERSIGWVYGVNTLGSVVGVALAGLVLLPVLGVKGMLVAGAVLDMGLGAALLGLSARGRRLRSSAAAAVAGTAAAAVAALVLGGVRFDRAVLASGVFRWGVVVGEEQRPVLFYRDGRTATVGAYLLRSDNLVVLATNGKPDASLPLRWLQAASDTSPPPPVRSLRFSDESTQVLSGLVALAHVPDARRAAVVGHGSGITGHYVLASPHLESLVTVEIEPEMIEGSRVFHPANRRVFEDPRSRFVVEDAKAYFAHARERFDLIVSEPSNPWVSGTASLFSVEFYRRVRTYLTERGVFAQWFHLYESSDELVASVLSALHLAFPSYRAFLTGDNDLLVVAGNEPRLPEPDWTVFRWPDVVRDLAHVPPFTAHHLEGLRIFDRDAVAPLLASWPAPNSDFRPVLDLGAERARFLQSQASGVQGLVTGRFDVASALSGRRRPWAPYEGPLPVATLAPLRARAVSGWLRSVLPEPGEELPVVQRPPFPQALQRQRALREEMASGEPPPDWGRWLQGFAAADADLHGGTAGVADSAFYAATLDWLQARDAPEPVRLAVELLFALSAWDFARAARTGDALLQPESRRQVWLAPGLLLDGTAVAHLTMGNPGAAIRVLDEVWGATDRSYNDFRMMLLRAHAEQGSAGGGPARAR